MPKIGQSITVHSTKVGKGTYNTRRLTKMKYKYHARVKTLSTIASTASFVADLGNWSMNEKPWSRLSINWGSSGIQPGK